MQGCEFKIKSAFYINPKLKSVINKNRKEEKVSIKPFWDIIKNIQELRREHKKGTFNNMMYKEIGNGIYGNVVKGMSNKLNFDPLTKQQSRVKASFL